VSRRQRDRHKAMRHAWWRGLVTHRLVISADAFADLAEKVGFAPGGIIERNRRERRRMRKLDRLSVYEPRRCDGLDCDVCT
jgi:hypothetical protein